MCICNSWERNACMRNSPCKLKEHDRSTYYSNSVQTKIDRLITVIPSKRMHAAARPPRAAKIGAACRPAGACMVTCAMHTVYTAYFYFLVVYIWIVRWKHRSCEWKKQSVESRLGLLGGLITRAMYENSKNNLKKQNNKTLKGELANWTRLPEKTDTYANAHKDEHTDTLSHRLRLTSGAS